MMMSLKDLSRKIDDVLDYFGSDPDYLLSKTVGVKLRKSMSPQKARALGECVRILRTSVPSLLGEGGVTPWKNYLMNVPLNLLRDNLSGLAGELMSGEATTRQVKLAAYEQLDTKFSLLDDRKIPIDTLVAVLYGPPGTGKSNYAHYLSRLIGWGVNRLKLYNGGSKEDKGDRELLDAADIIESISDYGGIFLVDEIDLMIAEDSRVVRLMHEVLDDIKAKGERCAIIMTTNNIDAIRNTPLCRPGRVDIIHEVGKLVDADLANICMAYDVTYEELCARTGDKSTVAAVVAICRDIIMERYGFLRGDKDVVGE